MASRVNDQRGSNDDIALRNRNLSVNQPNGVALLTGTPYTVGPIITLPTEVVKRRVVNGQKGVRVRVTEEVAFRAFNRCVFCGCKVTMLPVDRETFTVRGEQDRIVPGTAGGRYVMANLQIACRPCNARRGDKSIEEFTA